MLIPKENLQQVANEVMNMLHEEEIDIFNDFHDAVLSKDIEKIDELFKIVLFDLEDHFSTEEQMMEENNYSYFQVHKSDHDTMREKLDKYHKRWEILKSPAELQGFLETEFKSWIMLHISKWDEEMALHISHG